MMLNFSIYSLMIFLKYESIVYSLAKIWKWSKCIFWLLILIFNSTVPSVSNPVILLAVCFYTHITISYQFLCNKPTIYLAYYSEGQLGSAVRFSWSQLGYSCHPWSAAGQQGGGSWRWIDSWLGQWGVGGGSWTTGLSSPSRLARARAQVSLGSKSRETESAFQALVSGLHLSIDDSEFRGH